MRASTAHENDVQETLTGRGIFVKQTTFILVCTFLHAINGASYKRYTFSYFIFVWNRTRDYTGCPTRYRTRDFCNNFTTKKDIATKFEADLPHCVRNVKEENVLLFKFRCNIFIGVRIIKEMPGSVASETSCIFFPIFSIIFFYKAPFVLLFFFLQNSTTFFTRRKCTRQSIKNEQFC